MSKASNIDSLADLHERQAEVKKETKLARKGLVDSLTQAPGKVKQFAYEDLAIPVMGIGLAAYVGYRLLRSDNRPQKSMPPPVPQALPPARATENHPVRNQELLPTPRPANPPRQEDEEIKTAKAGLNLAAIVSVGRLLIPAAQAIMSAVQEHKASQGQGNSKKVGEQENLTSVAGQEV